MNHRQDDNSEDYRSLLLLDEISRDEHLTQREMSKRLGVALGLINSYVKNLAGKGYIVVSGIPRKRYTYYLTPKGFKEKARLTYEHLHNFTKLYKVARSDFSSLFRNICGSDIKKVAFCGVDEIAEIAFLSLSETRLELVAVIDDECAGKSFFNKDVITVDAAMALQIDMIIITSFKDGDALEARLTAMGFNGERICNIGSGGWLKRINEG